MRPFTVTEAALAPVAGHFGELMQGRVGPDVALITLPCPVLSVTASGRPGAGLALHGGGQRLLTPLRARALLDHLGITLRGRIILRATMPAGGGAGASTAALVALARVAGWQRERQRASASVHICCTFMRKPPLK